MFDFSNPGVALMVLVLVLVWVAILAWLASAILRYCAHWFGWDARNWRGWLVAFGSLVVAIHLANYLLDLLDVAVSGSGKALTLSPPGAFLIGSVAIGVGIAVVNARRG